VNRPIVCKLGGELIETALRRAAVAGALARAIERHPPAPLVIVHGGGRDIDAALAAAGIEKRQIDGLRVTDEATLEIVVAVLAGRVNTQLVAALASAGVAAVGLTGADGRIGLSIQAAPHRTPDGAAVDLGYVGEPVRGSEIRLLETLAASGFVPVVASIGTTVSGGLLNVNADTLAAHLAAAVGAGRLVIAGATAGVIGADGRPIRELDAEAIPALVGEGTATAGMVAKLRACERALSGGVSEVVIVDGRTPAAIADAIHGDIPVGGTRLSTARAAANTR
jgi:acetylglutamate kinase